VVIIDPNKKARLMLSYPPSAGRNFDEVLRMIDSLLLTDAHKVATPVNWTDGKPVIISPSLSRTPGSASGRLEGAAAVSADDAPAAATALT
jgi:alkyl hydroperoxide reductase subunit AhpC